MKRNSAGRQMMAVGSLLALRMALLLPVAFMATGCLVSGFPPPASSVPLGVFTVAPGNPRLLTHSALQFTALLNGKPLAGPGPVQWSSSNPAVATVDGQGNATLLSPGAATITASSAALQGLQASTTLTVTTAVTPVFSAQPSDTNVSAVIGPSGGIPVQLLDNLGGPLPNQAVTIAIANNAAVGGTGKLTGTLTQTTDATGTANFPDLKIDWWGPIPGNGDPGYTLSAVATPSSGAVSAISGSFNELRLGDPCLGPNLPACAAPSSSCADTDGDGLSDAWEMAGGMDFNGDGIVSPSEMVLTNVDPFFPDETPNPHPSADPNVKDVFVKYDWMELPDQLTNGQPTACTVTPLPSGPPNFLNLFYPSHSDQCAFDQHCLGGVCKGHSDAPDPAALMMVINAFAAHDIRLHLVKGHALPHANVITFGAPIPACVTDLSTQTFLGDHAVDFYALKAANFNASYNGQNFSFAQLFPFMHYSIFAHRHSCDSTRDCAKLACVNPDTNRNPLFNETGVAEQPGNDFLVSLGGFHDRNVVPAVLAQGGTFMHELGHNLGLNHGGPNFNAGVATDVNQVKVNYKPNYLSVMNYNHQTLGISTASPNCAPNDYVCKTTPVSTRLDYSSFFNGIVPNTLDENNGSEAAGINLGTSDIGYAWCSGVQTPIPGTGPVDFNCNGNRNETWCASGCDITPGFELNHDPQGGGKIPDGTPGSGDVLQPFEDWPNLLFAFQCAPQFNDGAPPGHLLSSGEATSDWLLAMHLQRRTNHDAEWRALRRRLQAPAPLIPPVSRHPVAKFGGEQFGGEQ